ncbi:putative transporter [Hyphodiscus hymeniophilus]|uniref:Transporter n=1 Tax=Hyphodiscus hymeniophilus TaxID=353542 RepID=A0A9P6SPN6_9HELO|nr:putative transporter [Hyphodiscus hymeniophilus]
MASNPESKTAHALADSTRKQEKLDGSLQFDEVATFSGIPVPKNGPFIFTASDSDEDGEAIKRNPFLDPDVANHWTAVYKKAEYECRHVFDPSFTWAEEEEKKLVRRLDWRVCLWACVMFFGLQVDRGNLTQAVADNLLDDLHLSTDRMSQLSVDFLLAELPSQLVSKKLGPDRWIPLQITIWSIVAMSQCAIKGKNGFYATRSLLGLLEGGFIPDIVLWLSYFYTSRELPIRLSYFWTTLSATTIITSILAFALLHLRGVAGWAGWRWLFLIEGLITFVVGVASFFMMPAYAVQTKAWFRPNGWFTEREISIVVNRVLRDDPSKGDMHNRQAITPRRLWQAAKDYDLWPLYAIDLIAFIPQTPPTTYVTLTLKSLGFSTFNVNLLTIPYSFFHICTLLLITRLSECTNERTLVSMLQPLWTLLCVIALRFWPGTEVDKWGTYALTTVLLSYPYCHTILVAWTSKNANNVGARSVSAALYNMMVQLGNICANFIYRTDDKPLYHRGNTQLIIINLSAVVLFLLTKIYYVTKNRRRAKQWNQRIQ